MEVDYNDYWTYCCPVCGYNGDSKRYFEMRNNSDDHECFPVHIDERDDYDIDLSDYEK